MKITTVLFDLDGTLLPMDFPTFLKGYFGGLIAYLAPHGYDPTALNDAVWAGMKRMLKNDGKRMNVDVFWEGFEASYGSRGDESLFDAFYREKFDDVSATCGYTPEAKRVVEFLKAHGVRLALATNPAFPNIATEKRMRWAGVEPSDFELYTTFDNSHFCKPTLGYYREVAEKMGVFPEECLMVGNDVDDDMPAEELGMKVFLLDECLINNHNKDITRYRRGGYAELLEYLHEICEENT